MILRSYKRLWIFFIFIILFTSIASGVLWDNYGKQRYTAPITEQLNDLKERLSDVKSWKKEVINNTEIYNQQVTQIINTDKNELITTYYDEEGKKIIVEYWQHNINTKNEFYIFKNENPDIIEIDTNGKGSIDRIEYYINYFNLPDIIETDNNNDGSFDETEIIISVNGKFIPISSFGNIIM